MRTGAETGPVYPTGTGRERLGIGIAASLRLGLDTAVRRARMYTWRLVCVSGDFTMASWLVFL